MTASPALARRHGGVVPSVQRRRPAGSAREASVITGKVFKSTHGLGRDFLLAAGMPAWWRAPTCLCPSSRWLN
jgi:hypothetical protein